MGALQLAKHDLVLYWFSKGKWNEQAKFTRVKYLQLCVKNLVSPIPTWIQTDVLFLPRGAMCAVLEAVFSRRVVGSAGAAVGSDPAVILVGSRHMAALQTALREAATRSEQQVSLSDEDKDHPEFDLGNVHFLLCFSTSNWAKFYQSQPCSKSPG